ncbi:hypothetical protein SAMN04488074_12527 [Lentzea albidocapillata subsp. violacea]|uniref:Uncharacterized protein n=1 Tax=Lentzea albidocapillata subsp. violacea TaxID=128104 RepID=A0A1G9V5V4_9PSEU|nr:hypothetical protein [Lentzea albidocapillata]SDM67539.1 hypothetical protein SAMN04488074_12527 [Lentzea albidocapillata subsp. violacea]
MLRTWHRPLVLFGWSMALLIPVSLLGLLVDDRMLVGSPIWLKPFKFAVSLALYAFTLAWLLTYLKRFQRVGWWAGTVLATAGALEMVVIVGQVVRGRRSHFNFETPLDTALFSIMGSTIVVLWVTHAIVAVLLWRTKIENEALSWSIRLGLVISFLGLGVGFLMTQPKPGQALDGGTLGSHTVGAPDGGAYMAITGWSTEHGDLRVGHFVGMHALQVLPVLVALLGHRANAKLAWVLSGSFLGIFLLVTWQALRGQPLFQPDGTTLLALAGIIVATALGVVWARAPKKELVDA